MDRRQFALAVAAVSLGSAGCVGGDSRDGTDRETTAWETGVAPDERLTLSASGELTATVRLYPDRDAELVVDEETYELQAGETRRVTGLEPDGHVVVLIDGRSAWRGTVGSEDRLELSLSPDGTATVTSHSVS